MATLNKPYYSKKNGVYYNPQQVVSAAFEQQYIAVRSKEARVYPDEVLLRLPDMPRINAGYKEWQIRKQSATRLAARCKKNNCGNILEVGCGNGWLSNLLQTTTGANVVGMDINLTELEQAARVFSKDNLTFVYDVFSADFFPGRQFDAIIFAASIQYFTSLPQVLQIATKKLSAHGTIHIVDTFFYSSLADKQSAAARTKAYYRELGHPDMNAHYFHHSFDDLAPYSYRILYNPHALINKLKIAAIPFPWIMIDNKQ